MTKYRDISYGELADYEHQVEIIKNVAIRMLDNYEEYKENAMIVSGGDIFANDRIQPLLDEAEKALKVIRKYYRLYGRD